MFDLQGFMYIAIDQSVNSFRTNCKDLIILFYRFLIEIDFEHILKSHEHI